MVTAATAAAATAAADLAVVLVVVVKLVVAVLVLRNGGEASGSGTAAEASGNNTLNAAPKSAAGSRLGAKHYVVSDAGRYLSMQILGPVGLDSAHMLLPSHTSSCALCSTRAVP
eukprot:2275046-Pleurochrysis_carterae.AAC.2